MQPFRSGLERTRFRRRQHGSHGNGHPFTLNHDLATRDRHVVGKDPDLLILLRAELDHRAAPHLQKLMDRQRGLAKHHGEFDIDVVDRIHWQPHLPQSTDTAAKIAC